MVPSFAVGASEGRNESAFWHLEVCNTCLIGAVFVVSGDKGMISVQKQSLFVAEDWRGGID